MTDSLRSEADAVIARMAATPKRRKSENRQRQVMLTCRVSADEDERIRAAAVKRGVSVASFLRSSALAAIWNGDGK